MKERRMRWKGKEEGKRTKKKVKLSLIKLERRRDQVENRREEKEKGKRR
jgi:hypothetical protein